MANGYRDANDFKTQNGYEIDGVWYPRVTRIVSIKSKPGLAYFYRQVGGEANGRNIANKSAEEGTLVHEAVEAILLGREPVVNLQIAPAIEAFRRFAEKTKIKTVPEYVERRICHAEQRYAGTVDALAEINGKFGVLDIKTSLAIYRDYNLQTAAYVEALASQFENLSTRWILRIDQQQACERCGASLRTKGGREKVREVFASFIPSCDEHVWGPAIGQIEFQEFPSWQKDFEGFLGAKKLWEWENEDWLTKAGYL